MLAAVFEEGFEQPIVPAQDMNSPPSEGFLMSEQNAQQENFALNPDQVEESAMIENVLPVEQQDGSQF